MNLYRVQGIAYWKNGSSHYTSDRQEVNVVAASVRYALMRANSWAMRTLSYTERERNRWWKGGWKVSRYRIVRFQPESVELLSTVQAK